MTDTERPWTRTKLALVAIALLTALIVALPLVLAASIVGRIAVPVALAAATVALLLVPSWRRRFLFGEAPPPEVYNGVRIPRGLMLSPTHAWAQAVETGLLRVGADDLVGRALGPVQSVELPRPGERVERGQPLFTVRRGQRTLAVIAPVSGRVARVNMDLAAAPERMNEEPYEAGWAVEVAPESARDAVLLRGAAARRFMREEVDKLIALVTGQSLPTPAMQDGGAIVPDLHACIDDATWARLRCELFGGQE